MKLTKTVVDNASATSKDRFIWDSSLVGFGLRVRTSGKKVYVLQYRHAGRTRRLNLGVHGRDLTVDAARREAGKHLAAIAGGGDPSGEKQRERAAATFGELAHDYMERHAKREKRTWREDQKTLDRDLLPAWASRKARSIERADVRDLLDRIVERGAPIMANRTKALISKLFNFGIEHEVVVNNPAYKAPRPAKEQQRERVWNQGELRALWKALDDESSSPAFADAMKLALLTAQRKSEVLGMRWDELDLETGWWTIPGERTKNGKAHRVPLGPQALAILRERRAAVPESPFVFPGGREGLPLLNIQKPMGRLRARMADQFDGEFKFHDARRTAASHMASIAIQRIVISKILNHVEQGVTKVYDRFSCDRPKREALLKWDRELARIVSGQPEPQKVVSLTAPH
jgi:integrase